MTEPSGADSAGTGTEPKPAAVARVLVVDDEESMLWFVRRGLRRHGFEVEGVERGEVAIERFEARPFDVVVTDLKMPGVDGLEVLAHVRAADPEAIVVMMTAHGTIATAVEAMRRGAFDYVTKPFEMDELVLSIERALAQRATLRENRNLRALVDHRTAFGGLIGQSPSMRAVFQTIELVQGSDATVLVTGESGTGKELVARAIHAGSRRAAGPFVPVHCAALPAGLIENELFGHEPGAFTGATGRHRGVISRADGGTLFLDEVAEIPLPIQIKLERFLQDREYVPLGGGDPVQVDARVVAATNRDLGEAVRAGTFREELFWRLNVVPIHLPPLRDRREDIGVLALHFLERLAERHGAATTGFTVDAMLALTRHEWPGNVRELQNTVERALVLHSGQVELDAPDLPIEPAAEPVRTAGAFAERHVLLQDAVQVFERQYLQELMRQTRGNVSEAARLAGISRGHLHRKLKSLGLDPDGFR